MSINRFLTYQIYLLQQENYDLKRFLKAVWVKTFNFKSLTFRQEIVWTTKLKLVVILAISILILEQVLFVNLLGQIGLFWLLLKTPFLFLTFCLYLSLANLILKPFDIWQKNKIINQGVTLLTEWKNFNPNNKVIAIAGSYGKSSVKNAIEILLSQKYTVLATTGNENTPIGISRMLIKNLSLKKPVILSKAKDPLIENGNEINTPQIIILELGEYVIGDIKEMCKFYDPNIGIITGINEAHLERMGGIENTTKAIFELADSLPKNANIYLNQNDNRVIENYERFCGELKPKLYSTKNIKASFDTDKLMYIGEDFELNMLANYGLGIVDLVKKVGVDFGLDEAQIKDAISQLKPVPHRLELIKGLNDTLVIDDSYNGNPEGVRAAIKVLELFKNGKNQNSSPTFVSNSNVIPDPIENHPANHSKPSSIVNSKTIVYCTPGLVEIGKSSTEIHYQLGKELASVVDILILVKNENSESMARGYLEIKSLGIVKYYKSGPELHTKFGEMLQGGEVILFQNDLTDNY